MVKKCISIGFLLLLIMCLFGCGASSGSQEHSCAVPCAECGLCCNPGCQEPHCAEKCQGHHVCLEACPDCGLCLQESCRETVCREKCPGHHTCAAPCEECGLCRNDACPESLCSPKCAGHSTQVCDFYRSGYITAGQVCIEAGPLVLDIGPGIWVPGHAADAAAAVAAAMEQVSGLSFEGNGSYARSFPDGKVHASFSRDMLFTGEGASTSELGSAWASAWGHAQLSPGDLFVSGQAALVHELGHVLSYRQTEWTFCQLLSEGFAEYTSYLTCIALQETDPQLGYYVGNPQQNLIDMYIYDYQELYAQDLEYWFENTFQYSGNANYPIGFRFMAYLQDTYGEYSSWILKMEELYNFQSCSNGFDVPSVQQQIDALKAAYGEDVLDNFYPWLKAHQQDFALPGDRDYRDLSSLDMVNLYPLCMYHGSPTAMERFSYQDLYINLEPAREYLQLYKGLDVSGLSLQVSAPVQLEVYDTLGNCTEITCQGSLPLEGVSCIRLPGAGRLEYLKIMGYEGCQ